MTRGAVVAGLAVLAMLAGCAPKRVTAAGARDVAAAPRLTLRVGLGERLAKVVLACDGPWEVRGGAGRQPLLELPAGQPLTLRCVGQELIWTRGKTSGKAATVVASARDDGEPIRWKDSGWRGTLTVVPAADGSGATLIDEVDLESYLRGVVRAEIGRPGDDALAAIEAQAVAARTYAISHRGTRAAQGFDLYADERDQVYLGVAGEDPVTDSAVARTAGLVLTYEGIPIDAYFHACCGGSSERPDAIWPQPARPYLEVRDDRPSPPEASFCASGPYFRWREDWTGVELAAILRNSLPAYLDYMAATNTRRDFAGEVFQARSTGGDPRRPGALRDLRIVERTASGRIAWLEVETAAGIYRVRGDRVRWVLTPASGKPAILRSAWFELEISRQGGLIDRVTATGNGYGHGVGMCQHGAIARARAGQDARTILAHYYPGTEVRTWTPGAQP